MIQKTYKSTSVLSFSITMPNGTWRRIRFTPYSWGGGIYVTANHEEQAVLESLKEFGTAFQLSDAKPVSIVANGTIGSFDNEIDVPSEATTHVESEVETRDVKTVEVADYAEAKEYLMEHFGYKSAQLRSQKAITEAAEKNGITFEYN